ncbi:MAG: TPR end-of-group domain-containing protein [Phycisphaerales bacterium]
MLSVFSVVNCLSSEPETLEQVEAQANAALAKRDFAQAEPLLRRQIELQPREFVPLYNLACVRATQGDSKEAAGLLFRSVENGFDDIRKLTRDPDLAGARSDPTYQQLVAKWPAILDARRDANLAQVRKIFDHPDDGSKYTEVVDEKRRFIYRSAFDPTQFAKAREEIDGLADWAEKTIFPGLWDPKEIALDPWVVIVLPSRRDFTTWLFVTFGPAARTGFSTIGGSYIHEKKQLVSQDIGSTLRHEFFHVLHWRDCTRKGQTHEYWVQEGLASLVEDVDVAPGSSFETLRPVPSWRTNIVQRRDHSNTLMPLEKFCVQPREKFLSSQQLANYAEARAIFLYLYDRGKLQPWYDAYGRGTPEPKAGASAFESTFGRPLKETDKDFRAWTRTFPEVAEEIRQGMASLGVEVETGAGDGVTITSIIEPPGRSSANIIPVSSVQGVKGELRLGDVITSVGGQATRDVSELVRVLGVKKPGEEVIVTYRRRTQTGEATIKLIPRP